MSFWADVMIGMFILVIAIGIITIGARLVIIVIDIITKIFIKCFGIRKICSGCFDMCCICRCKCKSKKRKKVMPVNYDEKHIVIINPADFQIGTRCEIVNV